KMNSVQRFYFDHNATTPIAPEVLETLVSCLGQVYGNASSIHHFGQAAKQRLEAARRQLAVLIHANPNEVVFTSGGTEPTTWPCWEWLGRPPAHRSTSSPPPSNIRRCWDRAPSSNARAWPSPGCAWVPMV